MSDGGCQVAAAKISATRAHAATATTAFRQYSRLDMILNIDEELFIMRRYNAAMIYTMPMKRYKPPFCFWYDFWY